MNVIHLIPCDGVGGVEVAARSFSSGNYSGFSFQKLYLARPEGTVSCDVIDCIGPQRSINDLRNYAFVLKYLHCQRPQLLIASLWRSYLVLIIHKIFHPHSRVVCFLHSNRAVHCLDRVLAWLAMALSYEVWTDSSSTRSMRIPRKWHAKARLISFVLQRLQPVTPVHAVPEFVFWGRLATEKNLDLSVNLIALLRQSIPDVRFKIIGPDRGQRSHLEQLVAKLGLDQCVSFLGEQTHQNIRLLASQASFYLQTSLFEGMAVSVVEAMQLGLIPVVTPVGEIRSYCSDEFNCMIVNPLHLESVVERISHLMCDQGRFSELRNNAVLTWPLASLYCDDLLNACREILRSGSP